MGPAQSDADADASSVVVGIIRIGLLERGRLANEDPRRRNRERDKAAEEQARQEEAAGRGEERFQCDRCRNRGRDTHHAGPASREVHGHRHDDPDCRVQCLPDQIADK